MSDQEFEDCLELCLAKNKDITSELKKLRERCYTVENTGKITVEGIAKGLALGLSAGAFASMVPVVGIPGVIFSITAGVAIDYATRLRYKATDAVSTHPCTTDLLISKILKMVDSKTKLNKRIENLVKEILKKREDLLSQKDPRDINKLNADISADSILAQLAENNSLELPNSELPLCVQDWTKNCPTVEAINGVIELLKLETNFFVQLQVEMERCKTRETHSQIQRDVAACTVTAKEQKEGCLCRPVQLKVLYLNARSVNPDDRNVNFPSKLQEIRQQIQIHQPNLVIIAESWLNRDHEKYKIQVQLGLSGYKIYRQDREIDNINRANVENDKFTSTQFGDGRFGGILVAYKRLNQFPWIDLSLDESEDYGYNLVTFNLKRDHSCRRCNEYNQSIALNFTAAYRRPKKFDGEATDHFELMNSCIVSRIHHIASIAYPDDLSGQDGYCFVGTLNQDFGGGDDISNYLRDQAHFISLDLTGTHRSGKTLDHVFACPPSLITDLRQTELISDHCALVFTINLGKDYPDGQICEKCK